MAERKQPVAFAFDVDAFNDYTGTPLTYTPGSMELKSVTLPIRKRALEEIYVPSANGQAQYAIIDLGLATSGTTYEATWVLTDPKNSGASDATLYNLLTGLLNNALTSNTAFASWTTTNPLTGGGKQTVKHLITVKDGGGTSHLLTCPVVVESVDIVAQGEHRGIKATFRLAGAPTWS